MSPITGNVNFRYLLHYKHCLFGNAKKTLHLPTPQLARFTELLKFNPKHSGKVNCTTSKLGTVGPIFV